MEHRNRFKFALKETAITIAFVLLYMVLFLAVFGILFLVLPFVLALPEWVFVCLVVLGILVWCFIDHYNNAETYRSYKIR